MGIKCQLNRPRSGSALSHQPISAIVPLVPQCHSLTVPSALGTREIWCQKSLYKEHIVNCSPFLFPIPLLLPFAYLIKTQTFFCKTGQTFINFGHDDVKQQFQRHSFTYFHISLMMYSQFDVIHYLILNIIDNNP